MREYGREITHDHYKYNHFIFITALVLWGVFTISPLLSYYLTLIILSLSPKIAAFTRRLIGLLIVLSGTVYVASRGYNTALGDDITYVYYPFYKGIFYGNDYFSTFSGGWEFVIGGLFKLLAISTEHPVDKDIFTTVFVFLPYLLWYVWLEKFGLTHISPDKKNLCVAASLGIFGLLSLSVQIRQGLSTPILLLAISYLSQSRIKSAFLTVLAICTHLTAIPIYFIIRVFTEASTKFKIIALGGIAFLVVTFQFIVGAIVGGNLLGNASFKLIFYTNTQSEGFQILSFFFVLVIMIVASRFFFDSNKELKGWKSLITWGGIAYLVLLPIPMASDRLFMVMSIFMMGYLLFLSFSKVSNIFRILLILYFIYKFFMNSVFMSAPGNSGGFFFWVNYDWIGDYPFYFWLK
jgi:hypothetical protein